MGEDRRRLSLASSNQGEIVDMRSQGGMLLEDLMKLF